MPTTESETRYLWGLVKSTVKAMENDEILTNFGASVLAYLLRNSDGTVIFRPGVRDGEAGATLTTPENRATKPLWINRETARITLNCWISLEKRETPEIWPIYVKLATTIGAVAYLGKWWDENIDTDVFHAESEDLFHPFIYAAAMAHEKIRKAAAIFESTDEPDEDVAAIYAAAMRAIVRDAAEDAHGSKATALWLLRRKLWNRYR